MCRNTVDQVRYDANLIPLYTLSEDLADGVIHFVGVTGALVASYSLLTEAWSSLPEVYSAALRGSHSLRHISFALYCRATAATAVDLSAAQLAFRRQLCCPIILLLSSKPLTVITWF